MTHRECLSSVGVMVSMGLDEVSRFEIRKFTFNFVSEVRSCLFISSLPDRQTIHKWPTI